MLQHLIQFSFNHLSTGPLWEVKTEENFKFLALKVVVVANGRWSLEKFWHFLKLVFEE